MSEGAGTRKSMREALEKPEKTEPELEAREPAAKEAEKAVGGVEEVSKDVEAAPESATREIQVVREAYRTEYVVGAEEPPTTIELVGFYAYGLCFYFVFAVLLPLLFPFLITQISFPPTDLTTVDRNDSCPNRGWAVYQRLVKHSIHIGGSKITPLGWTAISFAVGIIVAAPILTQAAHHLDRGQYQYLILIGATTLGSFACLLTGFFKTIWLFPFYILFVVASAIVADAAHTRYYGLLVRGLSANVTGRQLVVRRRAAGSQLSLYVTAAGGFGATLIVAFIYHMLRRTDQFTGLWVVSIFSGLIWFVGICHGLFSHRPGTTNSSPLEPTFFTKLTYSFTIFKYPHAIGSLVAVFLASFAAMCVFTSGTLYAVGEACIKPVILLAFWILYFIFPVFSLPVLHHLQLLIRADAVRMQLLGFMISVFVSGAGFYFKGRKWTSADVILFGMVQSTANGLLHAFGRVLLIDCAPAGKEGAFAVWLSWVRAIGACIGFGVGTASPRRLAGPFAAAFLGNVIGMIVLIFGNISNIGGMAAAGHVKGLDGDETKTGGFSSEKSGPEAGAEERRARV